MWPADFLLYFKKTVYLPQFLCFFQTKYNVCFENWPTGGAAVGGSCTLSAPATGGSADFSPVLPFLR
jgi:hypothetical protein